MPGLIPLMLNPLATAGNRSSIILPPSHETKCHYRDKSTGSLPSPGHASQAPATSSTPLTVTPQSPSTSYPSILPSRARIRPADSPPLASRAKLPIVPYTAEEWKQTIAEVKRQHTNRRYRACFARCSEILKSIKCKSDIEPVYLIYLHFYAATAMEMCARSLSTHSTYRAGLFQLAREHYDDAAGLIRDAEESALYKTRASPSLPSLSRPQSPGSTSSRAWTSNTGCSSPTLSVCSSEDLNARLAQSRSSVQGSLLAFTKPVRKKVAFELPKEELARPEPYIRPDSPTLGFDDEYFVTGLSRQVLPEIPSRPKSPLPSSLRCRSDDVNGTSDASSKFYSADHGASGAEPDVDRRLLHTESSADRYCAHLSDLRFRVAQHKAKLNMIDTVVGNDGGTVNRCPTPVEDGQQALERKARIERLRQNGWQRKRFDPSRYEALRNAALAELSQ